MAQDPMSQKIWENSEVLREFEKKMARAAIELKNKVEAQLQVSEKMKQIKTDTETAQKQMSQLMNTAKNLTDDEMELEEEIHATENHEDEEIEHEFSEQDCIAAKQTLLAELRLMAQGAIDEGNIKLAYKIERAIDEIVFEE